MKRDYLLGFMPPAIVLATVCLVLLTGCATYNAAIAQRGAQASDQALTAALWTICNATPVGAIKRRFRAAEERAAYNAICPDNQLP